MPLDKKPELRYQRINDILNRRSSATAVIRLEDLAAELRVSLRQINTDIKVMREELKAPLEYDYRLKGWRYTEEFDYVDRLPLRRQDILHLRIAVEMLAKGGQLKNFKELPGILHKIYKASRRWISDKTPEKAIYFDPLPHYDGAKHLGFFLDAIENYRQITFQYQSFHTNQPKTVVFDPYFLRHYDRRWYVGGFSHDPEELFVRVFPLERIAGQPAATGFFHDKPAQYSADTYWKHIYGITVPPDGKPEEVVLAFTAIQGKYFQSTPFFDPFDILEDTPDKLVVRLLLIPNIDLIRKLASLGQGVKVEAPASLAEALKSFHFKAYQQYLPPSPPS